MPSAHTCPLGRRAVLAAAAACALPSIPGAARASNARDWQQPHYPGGWPPNWDWLEPAHRVGNYSGGFERMFRARKVSAHGEPAGLRPLSAQARKTFEPVAARAQAYLRQWPITGLLLARRGTVLYEAYQFDRQPDMRMTSWSMAKSVTALLLGICIDRRLVGSLDDAAGNYVPALRGTLHGAATLRNLVNMSSGADVSLERDMGKLFSKGMIEAGSDSELLVRQWNQSREPQGTRYNYNELCTLAVGMVIRSASGTSLARFCEEALWRPMGAEGDASWLCDAQGREFNGIGFGARLRDWARLGQLIAQGGEIGGRQVVSRGWIEECASWSPADAQVRRGVAEPAGSYKCFFWHGQQDGSWMMMVGLHGQRLIIERTTQTVAVQTAVDQSALWVPELAELVRAAARS